MGTSGYLIDRAMAEKLREAGIQAVAISIDSQNRPSMIHSVAYAVYGNELYRRSVYCQDERIGVQINMSVMRSRSSDVREVIEVGTSLGVRDYQIFFPVPTGRAREIEPRSPQEYEDLIRQILIKYQDQ